MTNTEKKPTTVSRHEHIAQLRRQTIAVWLDKGKSESAKKSRTTFLLEQQGRSMSLVEFRRYLNNLLENEEGSDLDGLIDVVQLKLGAVTSELNEHTDVLYGVLTYAQYFDIAIRPDLFYTWTDAVVELFRHKPFWDDIRFVLLKLYKYLKIHNPQELKLDCKRGDYLKFLYRQQLILKKVLKIRTLFKLHDFDSCDQFVNQVMKSVRTHPADLTMLAESLLFIQKTAQYDPELAGDSTVFEWISVATGKLVRYTPLTKYS